MSSECYYNDESEWSALRAPWWAGLSRYDLVSGIVAVAVDESYCREGLADIVRLLYQETGMRSSRSMTRRIEL